jgi:hypothetical protein
VILVGSRELRSIRLGFNRSHQIIISDIHHLPRSYHDPIPVNFGSTCDDDGMCTTDGLRVQWDRLTIGKNLHFGSLEHLVHVILATESDNFRQHLECFEKWPLAAESEILELF